MTDIESQNPTPEQDLSKKFLTEATDLRDSLTPETSQLVLDAQMDRFISGIEDASQNGELVGSTGKQYSLEEIMERLDVLRSLIDETTKEGQPVPMTVLPVALMDPFRLLLANETTAQTLKGSIDTAVAIFKQEQAGVREPSPSVANIPFSDKFPRKSEVGAAKTIVNLEGIMSGQDVAPKTEAYQSTERFVDKEAREQIIEDLSEEATNASGIANPIEHESAKHFSPGQEVRVKRSSGELEGGWKVDFVNKQDGTLLLVSPDGRHEKPYKASELLVLNPSGQTNEVPVATPDDMKDDPDLRIDALSARMDDIRGKFDAQDARLLHKFASAVHEFEFNSAYGDMSPGARGVALQYRDLLAELKQARADKEQSKGSR